MKAKRKRKILWLEEWDILEQEAWFSDMALQGWQLTKIGKFFATFEQSSPKKVNYRCDVFNLNDPSEKRRIEFYAESGWEYVGSRRYIRVFKELEGRETSELHTDPVNQAETLEILQSSIKTRGILILILTVLMLSLSIFSLQRIPIANYLEDNFIFDVYVIMIYIFIVVYFIAGMVKITKLIKKLKLESLSMYPVNYKMKIKRNRVIGIIIIFLPVFLMMNARSNMTSLSAEERYQEIPQGDLPVLQIADILNEAIYEQVTIPDRYRSYDNYYREESSIIVPKQYTLHQKVEVPGELLGGNSDVYQLSIQSYGYEVRNEWLAKRFVQHLKDWYPEYNRMYEINTNDKFDELWTKIDETSVGLMIRKGSKVHHLIYDGMESADEIMEQMLGKMSP